LQELQRAFQDGSTLVVVPEVDDVRLNLADPVRWLAEAIDTDLGDQQRLSHRHVDDHVVPNA